MQKTQITEAGDALIITGATEEQRQRVKAEINEPKPATEKMLTRKQVADRLGVRSETVKRYGKQGLLHPVRFTARAVRYSEAEVLNLMRNGIQGVTA